MFNEGVPLSLSYTETNAQNALENCFVSRKIVVYPAQY